MGLKDVFAPKISKSNMEHVKKLLKKATDCAALSNTTMLPEVFFSKYGELEDSLKELVKYEKYRIFKGTLPSTNLKNVQENRKNDENAFIQRSYALAKKNAEKAGSEEEKAAVFGKYFDDMAKYRDHMDPFNIQVLDDLKKISL